MLLTKEQALKVGKRTFATVMVEELEGELRLVSISAGTLMKIREFNERTKKGEEITSQMMTLVLERSIVDDKGERLFDAAGAADLFDRISIEAVNKILGAVPGFGKKDDPVAAAGSVAQAVPEGNSEAAPVVA